MTPREKHYFMKANRPLELDSMMELVLALSPHLAWGDISLLADHQGQNLKANPRERKASGEDTAYDGDFRKPIHASHSPFLTLAGRTMLSHDIFLTRPGEALTFGGRHVYLACWIQYGFGLPYHVKFLATGKPKQGQVYSLDQQLWRVITIPVTLPGSSRLMLLQSRPICLNLSNVFTMNFLVGEGGSIAWIITDVKQCSKYWYDKCLYFHVPLSCSSDASSAPLFVKHVGLHYLLDLWYLLILGIWTASWVRSSLPNFHN